MTAKSPKPRLPELAEAQMTPKQRELLADIQKSRGKAVVGGPFGVFLHAPEYGDLAQKLGAYCRFHSKLPPRLSEFAILVIARLWRAQFEWYAHAPIAENAGVAARTIKEIRSGRIPKSAQKDERAIYDFVAELHKTRRVSDKTYNRLQALLGMAGMIEFTGLLGYYTLIAMTLNVFRVKLPDGEPLPFAESAARR